MKKRIKKTQKLHILILVLAFILTMTAGCGKKEKAAPIQSLDRAGNEIEIPGEVNKVVSLSPSVTRILIDMGLSDRIIAIDTDSSIYSSELPADIPQFDITEPDNEALIELEPDIVFTSLNDTEEDEASEDIFKPLKAKKICVADIPSCNSLSEIKEDISFIGMTLGESSKAKELINEYNAELSSIKEISMNIVERKTVLFMMSLPTEDEPYVDTCGSETFLNDMLSCIGARNVVITEEGMVNITQEEAIAMNPDVIITFISGTDDPVNQIIYLHGWENVSAIQNREVYYIDPTSISQTNNHITDAIWDMAKQVYPNFYDETASDSDAD